MGKRNKKRTIYAVILSIMFLSLLMIVFLLVFQIRTIEVTGNTYMSKEEVLAFVQEDELATNSVYLLCKFHFTEYELPRGVEAITVKMKAPWRVKVTVKEKKIAGGILLNDEYVYFDKDGLVLEKSYEPREEIYYIEGLELSGAQTGQKLVVSEADERVFSMMAEISEALEKRELAPDQILYQDAGFYLYFDQICAELGNSNLTQRIAQVPPILKKLTEKKGTLHLENYGQTSTTVSFEKNVLPGKKKEKKKQAEENAQ